MSNQTHQWGATQAIARWCRVGVAAVIVPAAVGLVALSGAEVAHATTQSSETFEPGNTGPFVVPNVTSLVVSVTGGSGGVGEAGTGDDPGLPGAGGVGTTVTATLSVYPGEVLYPYAGTAGSPAPGTTDGNANGGAAGQSPLGTYDGGVGGSGYYVGAPEVPAAWGAGGGGGAASVVTDANGYPLVVAGGGAGGGGCITTPANGGAGGDGDTAGQSGITGTGFANTGGTGGSGYIAGAGGAGEAAPQGGSYGGGAGGGGGGGYNGGIGAASGSSSGGGGGGQGGESYVSTTDLKSPAAEAPAASAGDGWVTFVWGPSQSVSGNLTVSANPSYSGAPLTLIDTLTPEGSDLPYPSGSVTFGYYVPNFGVRPLATVGVDSVGVASWTTTSLSSSLDLVAVYDGDGVFAGSDSQFVNEVIDPANTTLSVTPSRVDFGNQTVGTVASAVVDITNTGNIPWSGQTAQSSNSEVTAADPGGEASSCFASIGPGGQCQLEVTFEPSAIGSVDAVITLDSNFPVLTIDVTAKGVANQRPAITSISPKSGPTTGGTSVTVTGTHFVQVSTILVGGVPATNIHCPTATTCTFTTPARAHATGGVTVSVINSAGTSKRVSGDLFTYVA